MFSGLGGTEIVMIILVIVIFFGADKIPELARGVGKGMNEFRKASSNIQQEIEKGKRELQQPAPKKEDATAQEKKEVIEDQPSENSTSKDK